MKFEPKRGYWLIAKSLNKHFFQCIETLLNGYVQAEQIAATDWNDRVNTNLNVKLGKDRNSVPHCQISDKNRSDNEGRYKKNKQCQEICKQSAMFGQTCFETFSLLPRMDEWNENWCGLFWLQDDLCDHFKHNVMRTEERLIAAKTQTTNCTFS